jgi:hypothetical protein
MSAFSDKPDIGNDGVTSPNDPERPDASVGGPTAKIGRPWTPMVRRVRGPLTRGTKKGPRPKEAAKGLRTRTRSKPRKFKRSSATSKFWTKKSPRRRTEGLRPTALFFYSLTRRSRHFTLRAEAPYHRGVKTRASRFGSYRNPLGVGMLPYLPREWSATFSASEDVIAVTNLCFGCSSFFGRRVIDLQSCPP